MLRTNERSVAIDIFDEQSQNPDGSGKGAKDVLLDNIKKYGNNPENIDLLKANSIHMEARDLAYLENKYGKFRLFSIDGSHTVQHTHHDFSTSMSLIKWGGVIFVDDYYSPHWPGVHEAINRHYCQGCPKVAPFLFAYNKMIFTTCDIRERFFEESRKRLYGLDYFKEVENFGFRCVTL